MSYEFTQFARAHGVIIDHPISDGVRRRCATVHRPKKKNAWYRWDGHFGWVLPFDGGELEIFKSDKPMDAGRAAEFQRRVAAARDEREREYRDAAVTAQKIIASCTFGHHPYFTKKGLFGQQGLIDKDGYLIVPMRNWQTNVLQSLQRIDDDGNKRFLDNGKAGGAVFKIGPPVGVTWLAEGYATALSVLEALKAMYRSSDRVVCAFSAHNLKTVAMQMSGPRYIMADNDAPDQMGRQAGQEAARATNLPWAMPEAEGTDWNDAWAAHGAQALVKPMRELLRKA